MKKQIKHRIDSEAELRSVLESLPQTSSEFPSRAGRPRTKTKRMKGLEYSDAFKFDLPRLTEELLKTKSIFNSHLKPTATPDELTENPPEESLEEYLEKPEPKQFIKPSFKLLGQDIVEPDLNFSRETRGEKLTKKALKQIVKERLSTSQSQNQIKKENK